MSESERDGTTFWTPVSDEEHRDAAIVEYQYEHSGGTTFIVSVLQPTSDTDKHTLWLSTVETTATPNRHDYPVNEFSSEDDAIDEMDAFLDHVTHRIQNGSVSSVEPEIEDVQETIQAFNDDRRFPSLRQLIRRLQ